MTLRLLRTPEETTAPAEAVTAAPQASPKQLTLEQKQELQHFVDVFSSSFKTTLEVFLQKIRIAAANISEHDRGRKNVLDSMKQMPLFAAFENLLQEIQAWEERQKFEPPRNIAAKLREFKKIIDRIIELLRTTQNEEHSFSLAHAAETVIRTLSFLNDPEIGPQPFDVSGMLVSRYATVHQYRSLVSDRFPREWAE